MTVCMMYLHCFMTFFIVARIGFAEATYTALEDGGSVRVCLELCDGSLNRPIDVLLYTADGSAVGENCHNTILITVTVYSTTMYTDGVNYEGAVRIVTLLASGVAGDLACTDIAILDDGVVTGILDFSLAIFISDTHVLIPDNKAAAMVFIQPGKFSTSAITHDIGTVNI